MYKSMHAAVQEYKFVTSEIYRLTNEFNRLHYSKKHIGVFELNCLLDAIETYTDRKERILRQAPVA